MDLSGISTEDLQALKSGDLSKVSTDGLRKYREAASKTGGKVPTTTPEADAARTVKDMSFADKFFAGFGKTLVGAGQAVEQMTGTGGKDLQQKIDDSKAANKALGKTAGGFIGEASALAPTAFIPGVNTWVGAAALGGATGALQPTATGESRAANVALGAAGGVAGKAAGDVIGTGLQYAVGKAQLRNDLAKAANKVRDANLQELNKAGYVIPPSFGRAGKVGSALEAAAGKSKLQQTASFANQKITNQLARNDLHLNGDGPLTKEEIEGVRQSAGEAYENLKQYPATFKITDQFRKSVKSLGGDYAAAADEFPGLTKKSEQVDKLINELLSPTGKTAKGPQFEPGTPQPTLNRQEISPTAAVELIKDLRAKASNNLSSAMPADRALAQAQKQAASHLETLIEDNLKSKATLIRDGKEIPIGDTHLLEDFRNARQMIAKTYDVENAMNPATGNVLASKLGQALQKGQPLSGGLLTAAKGYKQAQKAFQNTETIGGVPTFDAADYITSMVLGLGTGHPAAAVAGAARPLARSAALTGPVQRAVTSTPSYQASQGLQVAAKVAGNQKAKSALTDMMATFLANEQQQK